MTELAHELDIASRSFPLPSGEGARGWVRRRIISTFTESNHAWRSTPALALPLKGEGIRRLAFAWRVLAQLTIATSAILSAGCKGTPRNYDAVRAYYDYDFVRAREALRGDADNKKDEQYILNNTRLGMASLADGDLREAERALGRSFEYLSTAGLNKDRTVAAVLDHEGVRIWKGEPFEQALTYHYVATLYAMMGDWENARAAAANALFRLTDFGGSKDAEELVRRAARDESYLDRGYTAVDTNFALGFLVEAIGSDLSGASGSAAQFDAAEKINPNLKPLVQVLRSRDYDTLLILDYGKGPTKLSYGPDNALVHFVPQERGAGPVVVMQGGKELSRSSPVCDVNEMALDHRWNNLEDVRKAKSLIGNVLLVGGVGALAYGADRRDSTVALAGLAAMGVGLLTKSGAKADTRYCEFMPQAIYLVPLKLDQPGDLRISIDNDPGAATLLHQVVPGSAGKPTTLYLRLHGRDSEVPRWLMRRRANYGNDATGVQPGDYPWILGGNDVSAPSEETLREYQVGGHLTDMTVDDLERLYAAEEILIGSGMENHSKTPLNPSYRHILEGGVGLFTPAPNTMGYKRIMCQKHPTYSPRSELVRNAAAAIRVSKETPSDHPPASNRLPEELSNHANEEEPR
jgi:hypothetical protein